MVFGQQGHYFEPKNVVFGVAYDGELFRLVAMPDAPKATAPDLP